jgi:hypothetical protein
MIKKDEWAWRVVRMGVKKNAYRVWVGKLEEKRQLGRHSHRWDVNIKMVKVKLSLCLTNQALRHEDVRVSGCDGS